MHLLWMQWLHIQFHPEGASGWVYIHQHKTPLVDDGSYKGIIPVIKSPKSFAFDVVEIVTNVICTITLTTTCRSALVADASAAFPYLDTVKSPASVACPVVDEIVIYCIVYCEEMQGLGAYPKRTIHDHYVVSLDTVSPVGD